MIAVARSLLVPMPSLALIHWSAWKGNSANFAGTGLENRLRQSRTRRRALGPGPMPQALRRAHSVPGGVGCSEGDERDGYVRPCRPYSFLRLRPVILFFASEELLSDFPPDAVLGLQPLIIYLDQPVPVTLREFRVEGLGDLGGCVLLDAP